MYRFYFPVEFVFGKGLDIITRKIPERKRLKMENREDKWACALCGHTADGKFDGDICPECNLTYWKCGKCGYLVTSTAPPDVCPGCEEKCEFLNVTCYTPECGGPGHIDPRL